ncbi:MAG: NAD(P)H-hydrate dehydratase [Actinomycetota bacterium]
MSPAEAEELDNATQGRGIDAETLRERAGWAVARAAADVAGGTYGRRAVVVCGRGNNGADGVVAARHLTRWGMKVSVVQLPGSDIRTLVRELERADLAIDAIFGTGFRGAPEGAWADAIEVLGGASCPVIAVDIPSGVDGTTGAIPGPAVGARLTVTFGAPKIGAVLMPGAALVGDLRVVDIGFPDDLIPRAVGLTEPDDVDMAIGEREVDAHKKRSGVVMVVAGSRAMPGAARLVAGAALRVGAGYVLMAAPASALERSAAGLPEAVTLPLAETEEGTVDERALDVVLERAAAGVHAVAVGPGLSTHPSTRAFIRALLREAPVPVVLDADGLNAFAGEASALADRKADAVLTPHRGEAARLGVGEEDSLRAARSLAQVTNAVALVKGARSVIVEPAGRGRINVTGTPALATAGTGDVLTGAIAGLLARGLTPFDAAWAGAYVHGLAGTYAGRDRGEGAVAGDVADRLPEAIAAVRRQA